jgi:hypothetical protein
LRQGKLGYSDLNRFQILGVFSKPLEAGGVFLEGRQNVAYAVLTSEWRQEEEHRHVTALVRDLEDVGVQLAGEDCNNNNNRLLSGR